MRTGLRRRLRGARPASKDDAELAWWLETWDPVIRDGGLFPGDVLEHLNGEQVAGTYEGRRWQIARAEVRRVLAEAGIEDPDYFEGKVVVDVGPGPVGFPDACPGRTRIGIEPLAERFAAHGLLLESDAVYLSTGAERLPLLTESVDVVVSRNSLDHVDDPDAVLAEIARILRPGGELILNVDVEHPPTPREPHRLEVGDLRSALAGLETVRERTLDYVHGGKHGRMLIVVCRKPPA